MLENNVHIYYVRLQQERCQTGVDGGITQWLGQNRPVNNIIKPAFKIKISKV